MGWSPLEPAPARCWRSPDPGMRRLLNPPSHPGRAEDPDGGVRRSDVGDVPILRRETSGDVADGDCRPGGGVAAAAASVRAGEGADEGMGKR